VKQTLNWLESHIGTIEDAELVINAFHWFLNVDEINGQWTIRSGEQVVFSADSRESVDAFLYGMALSYKGLPPHLYAKLFNMMAGIKAEPDDSQIDIEIASDDS
jgi:hypothetical protein